MFVIAALAVVFALVLAVVGAVTMFGVVHLLFSPWLLLVAVGIFAWIKFRPSRVRR